MIAIFSYLCIFMPFCPYVYAFSQSISVTALFPGPGSNVSLICPFDEQNLAERTISWLGPMINQTLNSSHPINFSNIFLTPERIDIISISNLNKGEYSCFHDQQLYTSWILILQNDSVPLSELNISSTESSIDFSWINQPKIPNNLTYELQITGRQNKSVNVPAVQRSATITELSSYSKYYIQITSSGDFVNKLHLLNVSVCTKPGEPTIAPNVTISSLGNTSVTFNLSIPDLTSNDDINACSDSYKISGNLSGPFNGLVLVIEEVPPKGISAPILIESINEPYTATNLIPFTQYSVNVSVSNGHILGQPAVLYFNTTDGLPDPPSIHIESKSTDSVQVRLNSPDNRGIILGYHIKWTECSTSSFISSALSSKPYYNVTGLRHSTCYQFQASAKTNAGFGSFSSLAQDFTTCPELPAPTLFNISAFHGGVKLAWVYRAPPASPDYTYIFHVCLQSNCDYVNFNSSFKPNSTDDHFLYSYPFNRINFIGGPDIVLNVSVKAVCLPQDCKKGWSCEAFGNISNVVYLDMYQLTETLGRRKVFDYLSDKAIGGIIGAVFAVILMMCCVSPLFIYCQSSRTPKRGGRSSRGLGGIGDDISGYRVDADLHSSLITPAMQLFEDSPHKPIPADLLAQHVENYHADDDAGYQAEFEAIEQNVRANWPTSVAKLQENMPKNRYSNVFAYDHTRVILKNPHGRRSDYINANYVDGYGRPRAFIAAQGPKDITFDDFWQMVWDENTSIVVMISNFLERGRRKCDQYWPSKGQQTYGAVNVRMISENFLACYVTRVFLVKNIKCKRVAKERIVRHYQYIDWRDFDVPLSPLPVLGFVKTTVKNWSSVSGPIIVHCSAGVGRTGTYICIESLIQQLEAEKQVNIRGFLEHIRQQRMKLVQTEQQYAFIHDALREYLLCPEHEVAATSFTAYAKCLAVVGTDGATGFQKQFEVCTDYVPSSYEFTEARKLCNEAKNRVEYLVPTDSRRVTLPSEPGVQGSTYINASIVQGYHNLQEFIVTQHPLTCTEADFWKMVWDKNSPTIVVLSSENMPLFWPTEPHEPRVIGWLRVGFCDSEEVAVGSLTRYEFLLSSSREDYALTCQLWRLHTWPTSAADTQKDFLKLQSVLVSNRASVASGSTIVVDDYGGNRAGIFCAANVLINQVTLTGYLDVYFIVKMLHLQRSGIFKSVEDLEFIYSVMEHFLSEMQQQDDNSSFLGNDSSCYANLSLFNGRISPSPVATKLPPLSANSENLSAQNSFFPLLSTVELEEEEEEEEELDRLSGEPTTILELRSLDPTNKPGEAVGPTLIGVLTPVKRANGYVKVDTNIPLPPSPSQFPPPASPQEEDDYLVDDDPTPTTSLIGGAGDDLLDDVELAMTV